MPILKENNIHMIMMKVIVISNLSLRTLTMMTTSFMKRLPSGFKKMILFYS